MTIKATYYTHMGNDLMPVNAARVSFGKSSSFLSTAEPGANYPGVVYQGNDNVLSRADHNLIQFLARGCTSGEWADALDTLTGCVDAEPVDREDAEALLKWAKNMPTHWTPFSHPHITIVEQVPIFVARQRFKHAIGFCVAGDTQIAFERTHSSRNGTYTQSVAELYDDWVRKTPHSRTGEQFGLRKKIKSRKLRVLNTQTDEFDAGHIVDVFVSGVKDCYRITLANGKHVTLTPDHKVLTPDGWAPLKDAIGLEVTASGTATFSKHTELACNGIHIEGAQDTYQNQEWLAEAKKRYGCLQKIADAAGCSTHTIRKWLARFGLQFDPLENLAGVNGKPVWNKGKRGYSVVREFTEEHRAAIREARSGEKSNFWKGGVTSERKNIARWTNEQASEIHAQNGYACALCRSTENLETHHVVPVYADLSLSRDLKNLTTLCRRCHRYIHANNLEEDFATGVLDAPQSFPDKPRGKGNTLVARYSSVIAVEFLGPQTVYDITVDHPEHNFVGNGVVLHNCYNEVSRRYVDDEPEFYAPSEWRSRPEGSVKQGSEGKHPYSDNIRSGYSEIVDELKDHYTQMINNGVAPEQARMILPQSMLTEYWVTGSLYAWANAYIQRSDSHAQLEIQELAKQWDEIIRPLYPVSWSALVD